MRSVVPLRRSTRVRQKPATVLRLDIQSLQIPNVQIPNHSGNTRKSTISGYGRTLDKYSPSKEMLLSPLKASQANLMHVIPQLDEDQYVDLFLWVVNMSEQYFYDNAFLLLSHCKHDEQKMRQILHRCCIGVDMDFFNNLEKVALLGSGAFGSVYSCQDPKTALKFAVKHLRAEFKLSTDHAENILDYMEERNSVVRSMDSPFVVRFYYSLQIKSTGALFLFFELCIGDLMHFINEMDIEMQDHYNTSSLLNANAWNIIQELHGEDTKKLEISIIYIFEMLCAMDFLVKCNIIHQDIKPDNVMITSTLHLKIGDFGLAYKTRTIHRETNRILVKVDDIMESESTNYEVISPGSKNYMDLELQLLRIEAKSEKDLDFILKKRAVFNVEKFSFDDEVLEPTYLTDTWAVGICAVMLLFRGFEIFNPDYANPDILASVPRRSFSKFLVHLVTRRQIYNEYVKEGLIKSGGNTHKQLMTFIASIFKPRLTRCEGYTKTKEMPRYSKGIRMRYIDMDIIERLDTFSSRKFNRSNIFLRDIPESVRELFESTKAATYEKFEHLLQELETVRSKDPNPSNVLNVDPGVNINFFT